ncbi:hypothetical protein [Waterburya agarophytonicola]|nr:hypothetical protein [Waterburya agarophytonicola]
MPRNGTNYLCDLIGQFQEIDSFYEIFHDRSSYLNHELLSKNIIGHINNLYKLQIENSSDPKLIGFIAQNPALFLDIISSYSTNKYINFKVFPNHLSQDNLRDIIIKNNRIQKIVVKRNLLDVYFSVQFARLTQRWDRKDTSGLKVDFNPNNFLQWFSFHHEYYDFIERELKANNQKAIALDYEKIHSLNNNQEKFAFMFDFLRSAGLVLDRENLLHQSPEQLNQNVRQKQDKRVNRLEKVSNPRILLKTLEQHQLESLLV